MSEMSIPLTPQAGSPPTPKAAPALSPTPVARKIRFANLAPKVVPLEDPIMCDDALIDAIRVTKITIGAYRGHLDNVGTGKSDMLALPMFQDEDGKAVPLDVLESLSTRDANSLLEVASGFLNGRPKAGDPTLPSTSGSGDQSPR